MRYQPIVVPFAACAMLLAGCAGSGTDERNYKVNDDPVPTNQDSNPGRGSRATPQSTAQPVVRLATVDEPPIGMTASDATASTGASSSTPSSTPEPQLTGMPQRVKEHAVLPPDTQPSVIGLDRSNWTRTTVSPESGSVSAYPYYFRDPKPEFDRHREAQPTTEDQRLLSPLRDPRGESWVGKNKWTEFFTQPGKMIVDLIESPYHVYKEAPWKDVTTPEAGPAVTVIPNRPPMTQAEIDAAMATPTHASEFRNQRMSPVMTWLTGVPDAPPPSSKAADIVPQTQPVHAVPQTQPKPRKQHMSSLMSWLLGESSTDAPATPNSKPAPPGATTLSTTKPSGQTQPSGSK